MNRWLLQTLIPALLASATAVAQTPQEAAAVNMQLALDTCMRHHRRSDELPKALADVGFSIEPGLDADSYDLEAPGVFGIISTGSHSGYCSIQSPLVPLGLAEAIGTAVGERQFPGKVVPGSPAGNASTPPEPCEGYAIWETQPIIIVSYAQAGNSGECIDDGTSAINISM